MLDEPFRHLDNEKKEKFINYIKNDHYNQIIFTSPNEIENDFISEIPKIEEKSIGNKNKLQYFLYMDFEQESDNIEKL